MNRIDINICDRVQTLKGRGTVIMINNDEVVVNLDKDHGVYSFNKDSVWKMCKCDECYLHTINDVVPRQCEWCRNNVTFGNKSADECPFYVLIRV
ncbi:MAG: hypothetical protein J6R59_10280 [Paludibacteraceae bacterium]|nr:hypothetical protein [Paludibacteraceae bacterium]